MSIISLRSEIRDADLYYLDQRPVSERHRLDGVMDALLDCDNALHRFNANREQNITPSLIECYGFLQVLYVQQDAVRELSHLYGLTGSGVTNSWTPSKKNLRCSKVRKLRNQLAGHPVGNWANTTAIIPEGLIQNDYFEYALYGVGTVGLSSFQRGEVNFAEFIERNEHSLSAHLKRIKKEIWRLEKTYRAREKAAPLIKVMHQSWRYEWGKVYLGQKNFRDNNDRKYGLTCVQGVSAKFQSLKTELSNRNLWKHVHQDHYDGADNGLAWIAKTLNTNVKSKSKYDLYDLVYHGTNYHLECVFENLRCFDEQMAAKLR